MHHLLRGGALVVHPPVPAVPEDGSGARPDHQQLRQRGHEQVGGRVAADGAEDAARRPREPAHQRVDDAHHHGGQAGRRDALDLRALAVGQLGAAAEKDCRQRGRRDEEEQEHDGAGQAPAVERRVVVVGPARRGDELAHRDAHAGPRDGVGDGECPSVDEFGVAISFFAPKDKVSFVSVGEWPKPPALHDESIQM